MKLISVNVEGCTHLGRVKHFLQKVNADTVCLMEAPEELVTWLGTLGYTTTFAPMNQRTTDDVIFTEGVVFASRLPHHTTTTYYHRPDPDTILPINFADVHNSVARAVIVGTVGDLTIATTHFTWGPRGDQATPDQFATQEKLLTLLAPLPPHYLVGDSNIPRHHNPLYDVFCTHYTDHIPHAYTSSLDATLHRHGQNPELQFLFTDYMVDYVFATPSLAVRSIDFTFEVSDHAAVTVVL